MRAAKIRKIHVIFIFFPAFLVISAIFLTAIFFFLNEPPPEHGVSTENVAVDSEKKEVLMELREGESASSIGARLEAAHLIKTQYLWNILCRIDRDYLKAGNYQFAEGLRLTEIHDIFVNGKQMLVSVTIPEGSTIKKTAAILEKAGICSARDFIESAQNKSLLDEYRIPGKTMEGYLSPDTYYFPVRYPATQAVRAMAETFYKKLHDLGIGQESALELHNQVILASIIEREYRIDEEAPVMAGVFQNRMKIGMRLESCASIEYIITEIEGKTHPQRLFTRDLEIKNPYNTYIYSGLPPGPICSPGKVALSAVFYSQKNEYLFFRIVDPTAGRHYFSKTFDDHIKAGQFYIKGR